MTDAAGECFPTCLHCAISELLLKRQPLSSADACYVGQVIADIIASMPASDRVAHGRYVQHEVNKMLEQAIAGRWSGEPA